MVYLLLALSVTTEVFGDSMMKLSEGFKRKIPIIGVVVGYAISFYLMSRIMLELPLGLTYALWTGLGIALTAIVGIVFWREGCNLKKLLGLAAIIAGVVVLELGVSL
jgi:multidrug transporter EmrE-like cation transporter